MELEACLQPGVCCTVPLAESAPFTSFNSGGEVRARPAIEASREAWVGYVYWRDNSPGMQKEWWYHKLGCKLWFIAERNTSGAPDRPQLAPQSRTARARRHGFSNSRNASNDP